MNKLIVVVVLLAVAATAQAYNIRHSYSGADNSVEYYGDCDDGQQLKVVANADGTFAYEGPAGSGKLTSTGSIDSAAAAACGE